GRFGRGPLDRARGRGRGGAGAGAERGAVRPLLLARQIAFRRPGALGDARPIRGPPRSTDAAGAIMSSPRSDSFVLFGATGDLAFKKLFPALANLVSS